MKCPCFILRFRFCRVGSDVCVYIHGYFLEYVGVDIGGEECGFDMDGDVDGDGDMDGGVDMS
jgi:hypothetical protein